MCGHSRLETGVSVANHEQDLYLRTKNPPPWKDGML